MKENLKQNEVEQLLLLFNQEKLSDVIKKAKILSEEYPNSVFLLNIMGVASARLNKLNNARKYFKSCLKINSNFVEAHYNLGKTERELGNVSQAISSYLHAIKLKPNYAEAYNNLANAQKEIGNVSQAIPNYMHAIKLKPNYILAKYFFFIILINHI